MTDRHFPGYSEARAMVQAQSLEDDLLTLDSLFGRDNLRYGATPAEVKAEALRQHELDWRNPEWVDEWGPLVRALQGVQS